MSSLLISDIVNLFLALLRKQHLIASASTGRTHDLGLNFSGEGCPPEHTSTQHSPVLAFSFKQTQPYTSSHVIWKSAHL